MFGRQVVVLFSVLVLGLPAYSQTTTCIASNYGTAGISGNADTGEQSPDWKATLRTIEEQSGGAPVCTYIYYPPPPGNPRGYYWTGNCKFITHACIPPVETVPGPSCPLCGNPIALNSGNTYIQQRDIAVPGLGRGLTLNRTWNSIWPPTQIALQIGMFGPNWRSSYEERIFQGDVTVKYARSDGSFWSFAFDSFPDAFSTAYKIISPANENVKLLYSYPANGPYLWTLTFKNGEQRIFNDTGGFLLAIVDIHGNTTQLSYDGLNRLSTVADPASRHLYFSYNDDNLVTGVTSDVGLSLSYAYDSHGRLTTVTKPGQTPLSFEYDSNSMITAVKDSAGKVLESHTYDSEHRGLTSSKAGGVEAITITYPQ